MINTTSPNSPIRWDRCRIVAFEDAAWHENGICDGRHYRVYTMRQIHGLKMLPDAAGRRRHVFLACVHQDGEFRLLGAAPTLRSAKRQCEEHARKLVGRESTDRPTVRAFC